MHRIINTKELPTGATWREIFHLFNDEAILKIDNVIYVWNNFELIAKEYVKELESDPPKLNFVEGLTQIVDKRNSQFVNYFEYHGAKQIVSMAKDFIRRHRTYIGFTDKEECK